MTPSLFTTEFGDPSGRPVLFVHGFPISHEMWLPAIAPLLRVAPRTRCILPDLPGYGRTPPRPDASMASYADDLAEVLDQLDERRPVTLIGLSMGGIIAFEFFRRHRDRLGALVLCDTRYNAESAAGAEVREQVARMALERGTRPIAETMIGRALAPGADPGVRERLMELMCATPPEGTAAGSRALGHRPDSFPTLRKIDVPTLIVYGREDQITGLDIAETLHREIAGSQLALIDGAGHVPPMENPDEFASAIAEWLQGLPG
jgi:pimeloyl-ACP methyl ester carboxylesterase